ncbi:MAG: PqiC family protein [Deltaproteobacteria bacterium]|nr:PqiC family protein [Deltaproteobacteria bacterium]
MLRQKKIEILLLCLTLSLAACLKLKQPKNKIEYYTLEYDPPVVDNHHPLPQVIRVQQFSVSPVYNSNRIIYRDNSYKRQAYAYHKWRANPARFVTYYLSRDLKESGLFKAVLPGDSRIAPAYLVEGSVDDFLERDGENTWEAVLSVSIVFMDEKQTDISQKILFQKTYHTSKPCKQKNPRALAKAMSLAMSEISGNIIHDLYNYLAARNEEK